MLYQPKWSKAKKHLKSFICEPLRSRVDFQVINYRKAHDGLGRAVITVDKVEQLSMCTITAERDIRRNLNDFDYDDVAKNRFIQDQAHTQLKKEGKITTVIPATATPAEKPYFAVSRKCVYITDQAAGAVKMFSLHDLKEISNIPVGNKPFKVLVVGDQEGLEVIND